MLSGRRIASQIAWKLKPQDEIRLEAMRILEGKYLVLTEGSRVRVMALIRVRVPDLGDDERLDYSAALRTTLHQQRIRGLFEGLHRAAVPFLYATLLTQARRSETATPLFEFDLVVGTWADGKEKEFEEIERTLEQRASVLAATICVALPNAGVVRLARNELGEFVRTLLFPGNQALPQLGTPGLASALCTFEASVPVAASAETIPAFYVPNLAESGREGILLGSVRSAGGEFHEFRLQIADLKRHAVILGMTGSGKSTTGSNVVRQVAEAGLPVLVLDWHNEYGAMISKCGGRVVAPGRDGFSLNPIEPDEGTEPAEHIAMVSDIFSDIYHFTHPQAYMFRNALQKRISESAVEEVPNLSALVKTIEGYPLRSAYDNETKVALLRRLVPLTQGQAGKALGGASTVKLDELLGQAVCVELGHLRDIQSRAIFSDVLLKMIYERSVTRKADLEHLIVVEEARNIAPARRPEDPPSVGERMISELRKFGEAMLFIAQFPSQVAPEIIKNSGTKIVHRIDWPEDVSLIGESMGLDQKQREYLTKMSVGDAVVSVNRIQNPVLVRVRAEPVVGRESSDRSLDADP